MKSLSLSPAQHYQQLLNNQKVRADAQQQQVVLELDQLWQQLQQPAQPTGFWRFFRKAGTPPQGLYIWGGVGRGKTWLMDLFFDNLPIQHKQRMHFHHFMKMVHQLLIERQGQRNPLQDVAKKIAEQTRILCFDEFFVINLTDAMIMTELFQLLFAEGIILVATSNIPPEQLYQHGLNNQRFQPVIDLILQRCQVMYLDSGIDYRDNDLQGQHFRYPLTPQTEQWMQQRFQQLSISETIYHDALLIQHRLMQPHAYSDQVLWISFHELCRKPRSPADYIELAQRFQYVLISEIPVLNDQIYDVVRRFIYLVDELYDQNIQLLISSEVNIFEIYQGERLYFEIQRTYSRLTEMQNTRSQLGNT